MIVKTIVQGAPRVFGSIWAVFGGVNVVGSRIHQCLCQGSILPSIEGEWNFEVPSGVRAEIVKARIRPKTCRHRNVEATGSRYCTVCAQIKLL